MDKFTNVQELLTLLNDILNRGKSNKFHVHVYLKKIIYMTFLIRCLLPYQNVLKLKILKYAFINFITLLNNILHY